MVTDVAGRVAAGVALLDERAPGWVDRVNVDGLAMSRSDSCVLGQLYGAYWDGVKCLGISIDQATEYGFFTDVKRFEYARSYGFVDLLDYMVATENSYVALQREWKRVISILQAKSRETVEVKELVNV